jgi:ABC-type amino acid transport substrate-binding protein
MERIFFKKVIFLAIAMVLTATPYAAGNTEKNKRDYTYFHGKDIAVITGVLTKGTTEKIGGKPVEHEGSEAAIAAVRSGAVAGFMHALTAIQIIAEGLGDEFEVIEIPKDVFSAQIGGFANDQALIDRFDKFLDTIKTDGTLEAMQTRWFGSGRDLTAPMPDIENSGENGLLTIAICSDSSSPYVIRGADGKYSGYSIELAQRFGGFEGKTVKFADMEFAALIPFVAAKNADFGIANMAITEARKQVVKFTKPIFNEGHGILTLKQM